MLTLEEKLIEAFKEWSWDLQEIRDQYIEAQTTGKFNGRRINPVQAKHFAGQFRERSEAIWESISIIQEVFKEHDKSNN